MTARMRIKTLARKWLRSLGYELVPYPPKVWVRSRDLLTMVFDKLSIDCVFDVGANHGQYGNQLRDIGYKGWIVSFEPVHAHSEELAKLAAALPPWRVFNYALGSANGQAEINICEEDELTSLLTPLGPTKSHPGNRVVNKETIGVRRLDSIFDECTAGIAAPRLYLKLDTQGYDLEVVRGAGGVLDKFMGAQTEVSFRPIYQGMPGYVETLREFETRGFTVVDFMPVAAEAGGLAAIEMDCVLVRSSVSG